MSKSRSVKVAVGGVVPYPPNQRDSFLYVLNNDEMLWSLPAGGVEPFEAPQRTCSREVYEETGCTVAVEHCVGIYIFKSEHGNYIVSPHFAARYIRGKLGSKDNHNGDVRALTLQEIRRYCKQGKLRSGNANVWPVLDYLAGKSISADRLVNLL